MGFYFFLKTPRHQTGPPAVDHLPLQTEFSRIQPNMVGIPNHILRHRFRAGTHHIEVLRHCSLTSSFASGH